MRNQFNERYVKAVLKNGGYDSLSCAGVLELSEADSFIEFCFEKACGQMKNGMHVLTEWRYHKEQYCKIMDTIICDFSHYSRHDASHSLSILESMEMIIGDDRLVLLSKGDLWLLLEGAYSHDIGMALTGEELESLWKDENFKEYLLQCLTNGGVDIQTAAKYYFQMNDALMNTSLVDKYVQDKDKCIFEDTWPAEITNYVKWLVADYIRRQHSQRNILVRKRVITVRNSEIPDRLYEIVVVIAQLHGADNYEEVFTQLEYEEKGIGAELIYPRFAAAMLRLGDVLDVENNRFSFYSIEHMIKMPISSQVHLLKHASIRHIVITTESVKLEAVSDKLEVCKCAREWFDLVDNEVRELIYSWNEIAPPLLCGCKLKRSVCNVYYINKKGEKVAYSIEKQKYFEVNKQKLIRLLVGNNIYGQSLDCIREYLQNAMDASKMQMWKDIMAGKYEEDKVDMQHVKENILTPYDISQDVYNRYAVKLKVEEIESDYANLKLVVEDSGIGMEKECIAVISNIGTGWRGRKKYNQIIKDMPCWLRPTGGFGIGIQSAFMITPQVVVKTQTEDEQMGRKITLVKPEKGGEITVAENKLGHCGTEVQLKIPIRKILEWNRVIKDDGDQVVQFSAIEDTALRRQAVFSTDYIKKYTKMVLEKYLEQIIPDPIIPINVLISGFSGKKFFDDINKKRDNTCMMERIDGIDYLCWLNESDYEKIVLWDCRDEILVEIGNEKENKKSAVYYKNVRMTEETLDRYFMSKNIGISIDFMGLEAEKVLKVHRNGFVENFSVKDYLIRYIQVWTHFELQQWMKFLRLDREKLPNWDQTMKLLNEKQTIKLPDRDILLIQITYISPEDTENLKKFLGFLAKIKLSKYTIKGWKLQAELMEETQEGSGVSDSSKAIKWKKESVEWTMEEYFENMYCTYKEGKDSILIDSPKNQKMDAKNSYTKDRISMNYQQYIRKENGEWKIRHVESTSQEDNEAIKSAKILCKLLNKGVIYDEFLYELLNEKEQQRNKCDYSIGISEQEKMIFMELKKSENIEMRCTLEEFYKKSWDNMNGYDFYANFPREYDCIAVNELPYTGEEGKHVIRPFSISKINEYCMKLADISRLDKKMISKNEFIEDIMGTDLNHPSVYFGHLMQWVEDHALQKETREDRNIIWGNYKKYVGGVYDTNFKYNKDNYEDRGR